MDSGLFFTAYVGVSISASYAAWRWFERPVRSWLVGLWPVDSQRAAEDSREGPSQKFRDVLLERPSPESSPLETGMQGK